jgi:hypothetical protein
MPGGFSGRIKDQQGLRRHVGLTAARQSPSQVVPDGTFIGLFLSRDLSASHAE